VNSFIIDGEKLWTSASDANVRRWDLQTGKCLDTIRHHPSVLNLAYHGNTLVCCGTKMVSLWDTQNTNKPKKIFTEHGGHVFGAVHDGINLTTGGEDMVLRHWDLRNMTKLLHHVEADGIVRSLSGDGKRIAASVVINKVKLFNVDKPKSIKTIGKTQTWIKRAQMDTFKVISLDGGGEIKIVDYSKVKIKEQKFGLNRNRVVPVKMANAKGDFVSVGVLRRSQNGGKVGLFLNPARLAETEKMKYFQLITTGEEEKKIMKVNANTFQVLPRIISVGTPK